MLDWELQHRRMDFSLNITIIYDGLSKLSTKHCEILDWKQTAFRIIMLQHYNVEWYIINTILCASFYGVKCMHKPSVCVVLLLHTSHTIMFMCANFLFFPPFRTIGPTLTRDADDKTTKMLSVLRLDTMMNWKISSSPMSFFTEMWNTAISILVIANHKTCFWTNTAASNRQYIQRMLTLYFFYLFVSWGKPQNKGSVVFFPWWYQGTEDRLFTLPFMPVHFFV